MSAARILVLGVVHAHGQAHGYQVRRELLSWRADTWAKIAPGSIYQALRTLAKHGLLATVGVEAGQGGPERTIYRITPDGETELFHLVRVALTDLSAGAEPLNAAFAFLHLLDRTEIPELLKYRIAAVRARLAEIELLTDADSAPDDGTPPQVEALGRLYSAQLRADIEWSHDLAQRIRDGAYRFADDATTPASPEGIANQA